MKRPVTKSVFIPEFEESMKGMSQERKDHVDNQLKQTFRANLVKQLEKFIEIGIAVDLREQQYANDLLNALNKRL